MDLSKLVSEDLAEPVVSLCDVAVAVAGGQKVRIYRE